MESFNVENLYPNESSNEYEKFNTTFPNFFQFNYTKQNIEELFSMMQSLPRNNILYDSYNFVYNIKNTKVSNIEQKKLQEPPWSAEETYLLLSNIEKYGTNWTKINIEGRTSSSIRNRWNRISPIKKKKGTNKCMKCGVLKRGHICKFI